MPGGVFHVSRIRMPYRARGGVRAFLPETEQGYDDSDRATRAVE